MVDEKIISISQEYDFEIQKNDYRKYDGFIIKTDKQEIKIGIENSQSCCEDWGYLISEDDVNKFIGSNLISITQTNEMLKTIEIEALEYIDCGGTVFINFETSKGTLQFAAYNAHNGYYGHDVSISSNQLNFEECI